MKFLLRFECIGDGAPYSPTLHKLGIRGPARYYVYRLAFRDGRLARHPLTHIKDYIHSNGAGTRGVYAEYILNEGECYEVKQPRSWSRSYHYYCTVTNGELVQLTENEAMKCLANALSE